MLASLAGVFSVWKNIGRIIEKNLHFLVSFSAGVFLVIAGHITLETFEHNTSTATSLFWIIAGLALVWAIFKILPTFHHHHDNELGTHSHSQLDVRKIIFSDAIHNLGDGVLIAASFATNFTLGIITTLSVFLHELIQEVSEFFVMKEAGYSTKKALTVNFLVSFTILFGSIIGYYLLESFEKFEGAILGLTAGSFLVVVILDLIPHSLRNVERKDILKHLSWFLIGFIMMAVVSLFATHE